VVHVGFIDDGAPIVLPMIGKMAQYEDNPMAMYIHGIAFFTDFIDVRVRFRSTYALHEKQGRK
jgi:hypothetical protein